jgi:hypothetical protein
MVIQGCLAHLYGNTDYWWSILLRFFPGISIITIINSNRCFFLWIDDMMAYKRPLVNWARIPGYWWIDSWDSLCSLHLCLTTGTDCTEKGAPHVHFFHCHPFWMGGTSQVDSKKGLKMRHFYIYLRGSMFFMGGRNQLRRATSSVGLHFGLGSLVQHLVFPMGWGFAMSKLHMADVSRFYLGHITYISPTTGFVDVWGRCMIWWLSILDGCDKPSWPLLLFDVDAFFCCLQGDYWENAQLQETIETPSSGWDGCHMFYSCALINAWVSAMLDH